MKAARLFLLGIACVLLAATPAAAGAAPQAGPCAPNTGYDPACDVDHDNQITIDDIQLTAGHWNQTGTWVSDNLHSHLGQTWTGLNNALRLTGSYTTPEFAPLLLSNSAGMGLRIVSTASHGLYIDNAAGNGVVVDVAGAYGLSVLESGDGGVYVGTAGDDGVFVNEAAGNGVLVDTATLNGFYVQNATLDGFLVLTAGSYGVRVNRSELDGVAVISTGGDGVDVAAAVDNGVEATGANRAAYFDGDVEIANGACIGCLIAQMAINTGEEDLLPGQIVALDGVTASPFDGLAMLLQVRRAAPGSTLVGVVGGRAEPYTSEEDQSTTLVARAGRPAAPGDYLSVVIFGPMHVEASGSVGKGQRVTLDDAGGVRAMRRVTVNGVALDEGGSSLGIALGAAQNGMVWVLVNPR